MKKLPNLESSFLINDTSWKNKTLILSTKTFKMMINFSKVFLQTQSFFIVWNQKQIKGKEVTKLQKVEQKFYPEYKSYIKLHIAAVILHHVFIEPFDTNLLSPRRTLGSQCICRAKDIIHTTYLHCPSPCNYVTSLLAYCRG